MSPDRLSITTDHCCRKKIMTPSAQFGKLGARVIGGLRLGQDATIEIKHLVTSEDKGTRNFLADPKGLLLGQCIGNVSWRRLFGLK
jgi:hypothetical protein